MTDYQLVIQFPERAFESFDALLGFEDSLVEVLDGRHDVDGHDIGSGERNIFVFSDDPRAALDDIRTRHSALFDSGEVRAAARLTDRDDYDVLWPDGDTSPFAVA